MTYVFEEELLMLIPGLISGIPSMLLGIASYVLTAMAIYTISRRRGLNNPWLAWIPVANCWLLGSLSDQYSYVVKGENKSKRKWLLILSIVSFALTVAIVILAISTVGSAILGGFHNERAIMSRIMGPLMSIIGLLLPLAGVGIAYAVIRYMALYDLYKSLDPDNSVLFLVLSILFGITEPFFLFFNRSKDKGMPPRKRPAYEANAYQEPVYHDPVYEQPQEPAQQPAYEHPIYEQPENTVQEPWDAENKDYL